MRGDGSMFQRGNVWYYQFYDHGKQITLSSGSTDRKVAEKLLRKKLAQARTGTLIPASADRLTFMDLSALLTTNYKIKNNRSTRTAKQALQRLGKAFAGDLARDIGASRIDAYTAERLDAGVSPSTVRYDLAILKRAFKLAHKDHRIAIPEITMPAPSPARTGFLEIPEFYKLHAVLPAYLKDPIEFLFLTSWRSGEMKSLQWRDVSLSDRTVRLRVENSKSKRPRIIKLTGALLEIIQRADAARKDLACPYVFAIDGKPLKSFRKAWAKACKDAECKGLLVHDLRRSGVRVSVRSGNDEGVAMSLSGHETSSVFRRYDIRSEKDLDDAAQRIDTYVKEQRAIGAKVVPIRAEAAQTK